MKGVIKQPPISDYYWRLYIYNGKKSTRALLAGAAGLQTESRMNIRYFTSTYLYLPILCRTDIVYNSDA